MEVCTRCESVNVVDCIEGSECLDCGKIEWDPEVDRSGYGVFTVVCVLIVIVVGVVCLL